jgi:cobalamin biosynthesis protein CobC
MTRAMNAAANAFDIFRLHGGKVEAARALFPQVDAPWLDLSTGISPWSYPHEAIAAGAFTRLPDPESLEALEAAAASSFGATAASHVIATPGSDLGLRMLGQLFVSELRPSMFATPRIAVVRPGYSGHLLMWNGLAVTTIPASEIEAQARDHDIVVLANPNNPDGRVIPRSLLLNVAADLATRGGVLLVDEAFADVTPEHSLCGALDVEPADGPAGALVVLRSFGKFFGLAGVRLGFVLMSGRSDKRAAALRHALGDWPVSGPAVAIGTAAYRDLKWQQHQRQRLTSAAKRLDATLIGAGLKVVGGTVLYRLARCADADAVFRRLAAHGILTRPFASDGTLLRVGLPAEESHWQRLTAALESEACDE